MRLFLVDDDAAIVELLQEMVRISGHEVVGTAGDGDAALMGIAAADPPPEVVLMDHRMPRMTGIEAVRLLGPIVPGTQFVLVTADQMAARPAKAAGVHGVVLKPFQISQLLQALGAAGQAAELGKGCPPSGIRIAEARAALLGFEAGATGQPQPEALRTPAFRQLLAETQDPTMVRLLTECCEVGWLLGNIRLAGHAAAANDGRPSGPFGLSL